MERIYPSELALLLLVFWGPSFVVAAVIQWRILAKSKSGLRVTKGRLLGALLLASLTQAILGMAIWISPLHRMMFLGPFYFGSTLSIGNIPFQAGLAAAILVTAVVWAARDRIARVSGPADQAV